MTELVRMQVDFSDRFKDVPDTLRFDWDNDRHQIVELKSLDHETIKEALLEAAHLLSREIRAGKI